MNDNIFGELTYDDISFMGTASIDFFGKNYEVTLQVNPNDDVEIDDIQYEAYQAFLEKWDFIQKDIAEKILAYYNDEEKGSYGPDDEDRFKEWWPEVETIEDIVELLHIDTIIVPEDFIMDNMGGRGIYVLFNRDWGGEDYDDNGVAVSIVDEAVSEVGYKDMAY